MMSDSETFVPMSVTCRTVQGAKIHVIGLEQVKERLGHKWQRLSALVHKLMRSTIARTQGPLDHFVVLDELSYAVTFAELSNAQSKLVCESIAREVCERLFGEQVQEISVRTVTAAVPLNPDSHPGYGQELDAAIEKTGIEAVYRPTPPPSVAPPAIAPTGIQPIETIRDTARKMAEIGLGMRLFPIWEIRKGQSNALLLKAVYPETGELAAHTALGSTSRDIAEMEIELLCVARAYAYRLAEHGRICAIGTAVSYETLGCLHTRIRYITALQKARFAPTTPLLLRIVEIPPGAPEGRLAELTAMLHSTNVRVALEFSVPLPKSTIPIGADGIGAKAPAQADQTQLTQIATRLANIAAHQRAFSFFDCLDTENAAAAARRANIRFATGSSFGNRALTGIESVPDFPLLSKTVWV